MEHGLKLRIEGLLALAETAVDESANGLMDRGDLRHFLAELVETTRLLVKECEELERERDATTSRLQRNPHLGGLESMSALGLTHNDLSQVY